VGFTDSKFYLPGADCSLRHWMRYKMGLCWKSSHCVAAFFSRLAPRWPARRDGLHIQPMATYTVSVGADHAGFDVEVIGDDASRPTILCFATVADANAWIAQNRLLADAANLGESGGFRRPWLF
jgi:hypothetical protein